MMYVEHPQDENIKQKHLKKISTVAEFKCIIYLQFIQNVSHNFCRSQVASFYLCVHEIIIRLAKFLLSNSSALLSQITRYEKFLIF